MRRILLIGFGVLLALTLIAAVVCTVLYLVLIPPFGKNGAAWATLFTFATMAGCMFLASRHVHRVPYEFGRLAVMVLLAAVFFVGLTRFSLGNTYLNVVVKGGLSLAFYPILYLFGFFTSSEKEKIRRGISWCLALVGFKGSPP